ncbi:hypothetical protein [Pseudomonas fluorescens]|uniref:Uncharacterized protein n=1 Tax=Pseudomonas fluorescens TaxID=294 RepID=A0A5E7DW06_PSEFL|nr:hypothetical protein [Pseudomonas fluorescens]VVO11482.1 hypothetical protein PS710_03484 [Pseudomonas fluorescens]
MTSIKEYLKEKHGNPVVSRLEHRIRGGANNAKGNAFETDFAVHTIAQLYALGGDHKSTEILTQAVDLVDDLVCENSTLGTKENFQLKNSPTIRWGSGIADDFAIQQDVNTNFHKVQNSKTILVISDKACHRRLTQKMPDVIKAHSACVHFKSETFNSLLASNDTQIQPFKELCAFPDDPDKVTTVWQALNGAWTSNRASSVTALKIVEAAAKGFKPYYFKLNAGADISEPLKTILDKIEGLSYSVCNGFLLYDIKGCLEGTIQIDSDSLNELEIKLSENPVTDWSSFIDVISRGDV